MAYLTTHNFEGDDGAFLLMVQFHMDAKIATPTCTSQDLDSGSNNHVFGAHIVEYFCLPPPIALYK